MSTFDKRPLQYAIYKGINGKNGVLQFDLKPFDPDMIKEGMSAKEKDKAKKGAVFIDAAKAIGKSQYDYENDIKFSMSESDLAQFLMGTNSGADEDTELVNIYHKIERNGQDVSKSLRVKQGRTDEKSGLPTFMVTLTEKGGGADKLVTVPVSAVEMLTLRKLFEAALPRILGW